MADPRWQSLSILLDPTGKDMLQHTYDGVIENVQKTTLSNLLKNTELSGNPEGGSVEAKRFANSKSNSYGTARAAAKGVNIKAKPVVIQIDQDREIVEEIENKDITLYGVDGLMARRSVNHQRSMIRELERSFFAKAASEGAEYTVPSDANTALLRLEALIQAVETTQNDYVDGVPRDMINVVMDTKDYGDVRSLLDTGVHNSNVETNIEDFGSYHGVAVYPSIYLPTGIASIAMVTGSVGQPVIANPYTAEKIQLSEAYGVSLFYYYGVEAVTPDLIQFIKK